MPIKKIEGTASLDQIEKEISKEESKGPSNRKKSLLPIILLLGIIMAGLLVMDWITSGSVQSNAGEGSVSGSIVNEQMTPVAAEIFVLKMDDISTKASADGTFTLNGIPAGKQVLIIAWQGMGKEIPITIIAGQTISIGQVKVEETKMPVETQP